MLSFTPFSSAANQGTYNVQITSGLPNNCINTTLSFVLSGNTSNPNAGADHKDTVCSSAPNIDLDSYLDAGVLNYGTWQETTSTPSGLLTGSNWYPSQAPAGTYTFRYILNGICSGSDTAIITIVNYLPKLIVTNPGAVCSPGKADLTAASIKTGSDAGLTYTYFTDAAGTTALANPNQIPTSGTYYIQGTSSSGCTSAVMPVTVKVNICAMISNGFLQPKMQ